MATSATGLLHAPSRKRRAVAGGLAAITATAGLFGVATSASAGNPPSGPGNIEVFPDRDMIAIEGYTAQAGQTATLTVTRGGQTVGTATGVVDDTGFREWNHDSASCFTGVTPDLRAGDEVSLSFSGSPLVDGMRVGSAAITQVTASDPAEGNVNSVTFSGSYGADVNLDRFAVEVVNPAMRDEGAIGERAIGWSPNEVPDEVPTGYTVSGTAANGEFSVTFDDLSPSDQQLVFEGQAVALSWMAEATTVEAQLGLTLAEYGLASGGAPGCPPGPDGAEPPVGEYSTVWNADGTAATVTWASAAPVAGGAPVTGYSVTAIDQATQRQEGYRVGASTTQVVLDGLTGGALYTIEVRSMVGSEIGAPFALAGTIAPPNEDGSGDTTAPVVTTTPELTGTTAVVTSSLTLAADEGTLYYTTDGSPVTTVEGGNVPSATATLYTAPIPVTTADTTVNYVAIDAAGNATHGSGVVSPAPAAPAVAPTGLAITGTAGAGPDPAAPQGRVDLAWNPVPDATGYRVRVFLRTDATATDAATVVLQPDRDVVVTGTTAQVTGLPKSADGQRYVFRVQSRTPAATAYSTLSAGVNHRVVGDDVAIGLAQFRTGDEFRISGSGTVPGATITVHRTNAAGTGPVATPLAGYPTGVVGAIEAPENVGAWEITVDPAPATAPAEIWIKSSEGSVSGPFPVEVR
ncbi:fibronectin type III domain-containing protein [Blastococcus sp. VKM Ac-2987]|uniref:fibronectin type III domain-containing protein n=1 Tax=Blastococcus sp. VKM Ac-2987 TaxID=3004141 RepID=UPI0022AB53D6|nr:fibronectin type III domain-containing protein [Blastococcus sp. VKM Ac-2987]MCZ2858253.1 fibronectin type III domain-containing protein [Blastococcus sp. VKM Ac-2987]